MTKESTLSLFMLYQDRDSVDQEACFVRVIKNRLKSDLGGVCSVPRTSTCTKQNVN